MNNTKLILTVAVILATRPLHAQIPDDVVPAAKESKGDLAAVINFISGDLATAASVNVVHDVISKKIRIFTTKVEAQRDPFKLNGYDVEVIYNVHMTTSRAGVGYRFQDNDAILTFAAAKFASGEKDLGLSLIKLLAKAEPDLFWDSPHPVMSIDQIVEGLSKDDGSLRGFLGEMSAKWQRMVKGFQIPDDVLPAENASKEELVAVINSILSDVVTAASANVAHDVVSKRIRMFTTTAEGQRTPFKVDGYDVEAVYNVHMATSKAGTGSYRFQQNDAILTFAAAKFASGEKDLGLSLIKLLAKAEPDLFWDSPHPVMSIDQIVEGLSKDDRSLKQFLGEMSDKWQRMQRNYGV